MEAPCSKLRGMHSLLQYNYRWLSKKVYPPLAAPKATRVHVQGVVDGTFYDAIFLA